MVRQETLENAVESLIYDVAKLKVLVEKLMTHYHVMEDWDVNMIGETNKPMYRSSKERTINE